MQIFVIPLCLTTSYILCYIKAGLPWEETLNEIRKKNAFIYLNSLLEVHKNLYF